MKFEARVLLADSISSCRSPALDICPFQLSPESSQRHLKALFVCCAFNGTPVQEKVLCDKELSSDVCVFGLQELAFKGLFVSQECLALCGGTESQVQSA